MLDAYAICFIDFIILRRHFYAYLRLIHFSLIYATRCHVSSPPVYVIIFFITCSPCCALPYLRIHATYADVTLMPSYATPLSLPCLHCYDMRAHATRIIFMLR